MKNILGLLALAFLFSGVSPAIAAEEDGLVLDESAISDEAARPWNDEHAAWQCSAQAPRLIRVFTVRQEGYKSDVQAEALRQCNERSVLQCWPLGCHKLRRF